MKFLKKLPQLDMAEFMSLIYIGCITVLCAGMVYEVAASKKKETPPPQEEHVYYIKYGSVLCGQIEYLPCGVRLSKCADDYVYECMSDVRRSR